MKTDRAIVLSADTLSPQEIGGLFQKAQALQVDTFRHLLDCGRLLKAKRESLDRGEWLPWVEANRETLGFGVRTAQRLIVESNNASLTSHLAAPDALKLSRQIWGNSERRAPKLIAASSNQPPPSKPEPEPIQPSASTVHAPDKHAAAPAESAAVTEPDMPTADEMAEMDANIDQEYSASIAKVMEADDKLAAANAEIKRQAAEIAALKVARDGFMNGKEAVLQLLKAEQRKTDRLERKCADFERANERLKADNEALRERIAVMEES